MDYTKKIAAKKQEAINELPDGRYLVGKVYSECCNAAVGRSTFKVCHTLDAAEGEAVNLIGDYDLSRSRFWDDSFAETEGGDPALDAAIADLQRLGRITLGDFEIILEVL